MSFTARLPRRLFFPYAPRTFYVAMGVVIVGVRRIFGIVRHRQIPRIVIVHTYFGEHAIRFVCLDRSCFLSRCSFARAMQGCGLRLAVRHDCDLPTASSAILVTNLMSCANIATRLLRPRLYLQPSVLAGLQYVARKKLSFHSIQKTRRTVALFTCWADAVRISINKDTPTDCLSTRKAHHYPHFL